MSSQHSLIFRGRQGNITEFLVWSEEQDGKWEPHDGVPVRLHDPVKMQSERIAHIRVKNRILRALEKAIDTSGLPCEALADGATVKIDDTKSYIPDALLYCGPSLDNNDLIAPEPVLIVEVLSPSTAYKDVSTKLIDYFLLPSIMHYLVLDPDSKQIQHHFRKDGKAGGPRRTVTIYENSLQLDPPELTIELSGLWE